MTFKRDFGVCYLLSKVLEKFGCDTFIASNNEYLSMPVRLWRPDAVFYVTPGRTEVIKKTFPDAELFLWCAEGGGLDYIKTEESYLFENRQLLDFISQVYVWGKGTKTLLEKEVAEIIPDDDEINKILEQKFLVTGNPRVDIAKYSKSGNDGADTGKIKIGIIGSFYWLNKRRTKENLLKIILGFSQEQLEEGKMLEDLIFQIQLLGSYYSLIETLDSEKYEFSIRPYPLENVDNYLTSDLYKKGKFTIDDSLDFCSWASKQDVLLGVASTTLYSVAMCETSYINMNLLYGESSLRLVHQKIQEAVIDHCPKTEEELIEMIENRKKYRILDSSPTIKEQLKEFYKYHSSKSIISEIAENIFKALKQDGKQKLALSNRIFRLCIDFRMKYLLFRNREAFKKDYSYFERNSTFTKAGREFLPVLKRILEEIEE